MAYTSEERFRQYADTPERVKAAAHALAVSNENTDQDDEYQWWDYVQEAEAVIAAWPERPWNHVMFGDGTEGWLRPFGSYNEIINPDGTVCCNHGDHLDCTRTDHVTKITYSVEPLTAEESP